MINRSKVIVGLFALLATVSAIGFGLMFTQIGHDSCLDDRGIVAGSCPSLAEVNGVRYTISVARGVAVEEPDLTAYARINRTNVPDYFRELQTYTIDGIPAAAILVAPSTSVLDEDDSAYRILWGPDDESAFPALCEYLTDAEKLNLDGCRAPA